MSALPLSSMEEVDLQPIDQFKLIDQQPACTAPPNVIRKALHDLGLQSTKRQQSSDGSCSGEIKDFQNIENILAVKGGLLQAAFATREAAKLDASAGRKQWRFSAPTVGLPAAISRTVPAPHEAHNTSVRLLLALQPSGRVQASLIPQPEPEVITSVQDLVRCKTKACEAIIKGIQLKILPYLKEQIGTPSQAQLAAAAANMIASSRSATAALHSDRALLVASCSRRCDEMRALSSACIGSLNSINAAVLVVHTEARRAWRKARAKAQHDRLAALKADDIEAYMALMHTAKSEKINHLLSATDSCLRQLAGRLQVERTGTALRAADVAESSHPGPSKEQPAAGQLAALKESTEAWNVLASGAATEMSAQPALLTGGELREYQIQGLRWMVSLRNAGLNGILADEMGLGKTVQVISLVAYLLEVGACEPAAASGISGASDVAPKPVAPRPVLIAAPASVLPNWEREFQTWAPSISVVIYRGTVSERETLFQRQMRGARRKDKPPPFQVALTTYEFLMGKTDRPRLASIPWEYIVIDEGHRLKNSACKLNNELRAYTAPHRLLLTGTPLQNNLDELWALLNFLMPGMFDSAEDFQTWFGGTMQPRGACTIDTDDGIGSEDEDAAHAALLSEEEVLIVTNRLHQVLRPFMLRRLKEAVAGELPAKVEHVIRCRPSAYQKGLFAAVEEQLASPGGVRGVSNVLMELRSISNHPLISRLHPEGAESSLPSHPLPPEVRLCGKLEVLDRLLIKLKATGHRVLIFCTMTLLLDVLEGYMEWRGLSYLRLDGSTKPSERGELVEAFNAPVSESFAFLLSVRAGGVGLNLQSADTVIFYDTDWNPQMDAQAAARVHRIGQQREVLVLRLVTQGTVEERVVAVAEEKRGVAEMSITGGFFDGKTGAAERQRFLLGLIREEGARRAGGGLDSTGLLPNAELNQLVARNKEELGMCEAEDRRMAEAELRAWSALGSPGEYSRLALENEVKSMVDAALEDLSPVDPDAGKEFGRGKRARV